LVQIWEELLSVRPVGATDDFFDLGGHSLLAVQLMHRIEQVFAKKIPMAAMFTRRTVRQLAEIIVDQYSAQFDKPMVQVQPGRGKNPLFFLHGDYRGGGIYALALARELGEDQPFYVLNPIGTNGDGPTTIEEMAALYIQMIRAVKSEGPYLLGGHCNGGVLAYEMARQLSRQKQAVELVAVISARMKRNPGMMLLLRCVATLAYLTGLESKAKRRLFYRAVELYVYFRNRLKDVARSPVRAQVDWFFGQFRGDFLRPPTVLSASGPQDVEPLDGMSLALQAYIPREYSGRVVLFQPGGRVPDGGKPADLGWSRIVSNLEVQAVPGDHLSCVSTYGKTLARLLKSRLEARPPQA
jgi:thioesterase domain-containing protein/acyl carrier protein